MENKKDPSNSLKRTWVQSKGNSKVAILGVTVGIPERLNRDRRQHELYSTIYLHVPTNPVQGDLYTVNKYSYPFFTVYTQKGPEK